jgi:hypothetical protein
MKEIGINLTSTLSGYLKDIPKDPSTGTASDTRYYINRNASVLTVGACDSEGEGVGGTGTGPSIAVSE